MRTLRVVLLVAAVACTGVVVFVRHDYQTTPDGDLIEARTRIGLPLSPWYERLERAGGVTSEVNLLTLSAVFGLAAVSGFLGYARLGWSKAIRETTRDAAEPHGTPDTGRDIG